MFANIFKSKLTRWMGFILIGALLLVTPAATVSAATPTPTPQTQPAGNGKAAPAKLAQQFVAPFQIAFKGVQTFVIPPRQYFLRAAGKIRNMNLDVGGLTDSIQPSDALFEQFRIQRQVKQD